MKRQAGFTLIELVIVIVILGILAAAALPRFANLTADAQRAAVSGASGGLAGGVSIAHARWLADGGTGATVTVEGATLNVGATGWPTATDAATCVSNVWNVMQNAPSAVASGGYTNQEYAASFAAGPPATCTFDYQNGGARTIVYDTTTGAITLTNP